MKTLFIEKEIKYTGKELSPHWIYKNFKIMGNAIVAFIGECEVNLDHMVDIEDVINNEPIYSKKMLSIIEENFNCSLVEMVYKQRLLVTITKELIEKNYPNVNITRNGDDLYVNNKKLSVSIATKSITSTLIHFGLNIDSTGAPINASDLEKDIGITDIKNFAIELLTKYKNETEDIEFATSKVRGVI
ncbi:TPA: DUF366 family protein [Candidatus Avigastranaerophilus faecigallinarum]|nr:DUF366 family protein [Candidatus Avigastranaerophilus faecigallinarum]